jgi:hypothetical protein
MTLETKLAPGERAWVLLNDRVQKLPVGSVKVVASNHTDSAPIGVHTVEINYCFRIYDTGGAFKEWRDLPDRLVHRTREELLASL